MKKQTDIILAELRAKRTVSNLTAVHMNIGNIKDVIFKLRNEGVEIDTVTDTDALGRSFTRWELMRGNFVR